MIANLLTSPSFSTPFSKNIDTTLRSVFPYMSRNTIYAYNGLSREKDALNNNLYIYWNEKEDPNLTVYTDNKNSMYLDKPQKSSFKILEDN